jgi:hypothetical protein
MASADQQAKLLYEIQVEATKAVRDVEAFAGKVRQANQEAANSGKAFSGMQRGVQNASYQMTDFVVQVTGGQDAMRALGQQAPQLLAGFGAVGAAIGLLTALLPVVVSSIQAMGDASVKAANDLKQWTTEMEALGKMGKEIESFAKSVTGTAANGFKAYVEEYNKASKAQRAEMEAWLKLKLEVEQAKLNDLTSEARGRNIDWGSAFGGTQSGEVNYTPDKDRLVALGSEIRLQADNVKRLAAAVKGDFKAAMAGATPDKAQQKIIDEYQKALSALTAKQDELRLSSENLSQTQENYLSIFNKVTESEKAKLKLDEDIKANVNKFNEVQRQNLYQIIEQNIAIEKSNLYKTEANKILMESETPLDTYTRQMAIINEIHRENYISQERFNNSVAKIKDNLANATPMIQGIGSAINNAFTDMAFAGKAMSDIFQSLVKDLARVAYQVMVTEPLIRSLKQAMSGMSFFAGSKYSGGADGYTLPSGESVPSAKGNVFDAPISSGVSNVIPFAKGGVVTSPTYFPMAKGTGLMGESGAEAIVPLKRGADGKLGVAAGNSGSTQVNVYNQSGGQVETNERKDPNGNKFIDIYIKKAMAEGIGSGEFDKAFGASYGLRRQGAR